MRRAIVVGASSGIGEALVRVLAREGYEIGLMSRRLERLDNLRESLPTRCYPRRIDLVDATDAAARLETLLVELGGVDLIVIAAGVGFPNPDLSWQFERDTIDVNVSGFAAVAGVAYRAFAKARRGHLVAISSVACLRGNAQAPAYNASKAFISNYLEALRIKAEKAKLPIAVTEIRPGFVATAMAKGEGLFWVASPEKAAEQIWAAIHRKAPRAYITKRWLLIANFLRALPGSLYAKL